MFYKKAQFATFYSNNNPYFYKSKKRTVRILTDAGQ